MSGICGWSIGAEHAADQNALDAMLKHLGPYSDRAPQRHHLAGAAVGCAGLGVSATAAHGLLVAVQGCPVWAAATPAQWLSSTHLAERCAAAYRADGAGFLAYLDGQFALALVDPERGALLLAVDRTGSESVCFARAQAGVVFASTTDALGKHPAVGHELDPQALFDYVYFHMIPAPRTVYSGMERLLPGQYLEADRDGVRTAHYWKPDYRHIAYEDFDSRKSQLRTLLRDSVRDSLCSNKVGAFLSGGLDSSTVAGVLSEVSEGEARTFSIGFDAPGYDESEYARTAARHFNTRHREYYVTQDDVVAAVPLIAAAFDSPFGNASAIPAYYCAKLAAEEGIEVMLGGDGGDELFGGNSRYAKQWVFSLYEQVPSFLRGSVLEPALRALPSAGPVRKARSYVEQSNLGMPDRLESYNLLTRLGPARVFTEDFLGRVNPEQPLGLVREIYRGAQANDMLNRMLALDMRVTLADNDLRKVTRACDAAGVIATFPLLDRRLIEFAQQLPPDWKVKRTRLRDFYKRALADFLPAEVISKSKHGFGLPFGVWMRDHPGLHALAHDSLVSLRQRNIVRADFIDELTSDRLNQHAAYYGTMVWILMMLEQWFQTRTG